MTVKAKLSRRRVLPASVACATIALGGGIAIAAGGSASEDANHTQGRNCLDSKGASGASVDTQHEESTNWSGYVVDSKSGHGFSAVTGAWKVPTVTASRKFGFSADWIGLGGSKQNSKALEQTGTSSDVVDGKAQYSAWYEIVPAAESEFKLAVHPGDHMYSTVTVDGTTVTMSLADRTTGHAVSKTEHSSKTDTSSAEWIAEAPSGEVLGSSHVLPLADFGTVTFESASATAAGSCGSISDPNWSVGQMKLNPSAPFGLPGASEGSLTIPGTGVTVQASGGAKPAELSSDGSSFSVSYNSAGATTSGSGSSSGHPRLPLPFGFAGRHPDADAERRAGDRTAHPPRTGAAVGATRASDLVGAHRLGRGASA